jgi:lysophospholipase L1-like esterase
MKTVSKILITAILLLTFNACEKDNVAPNPQNDSINKIMALGASRVQGNRPVYESFRYELWKDLTENGWVFDYIGTQSDQASYPIFNNSIFDIDHEGRSGWTSGQILSNVNSWLAETGAPDIVLFSSPGGNDALQNLPYDQTIINIKGIVNALQNSNPDVTILIEQLAPAKSFLMTTQLTNQFNQLKQDILTIASENTTTSSKVIAIDMFTGFTDSLLADGIHYNETGADFIANRYYTVLKNILEK